MRNLLRLLFPLALTGGLVACGTSGSTTGGDATASGSGGKIGPADTTGAQGGTIGTTGAGGGTTGSAGGKTGGGGSSGGVSGSGGATTGSSGGATGATGGRAGSIGGAGGATTGAGGAPGSTGGTTGGASVSVLQHHNNPSRDGVYVDARITRAAAATMHVDTTFANTAILGPVYAQPLYLSGASGGADVVVVATAQNHVYGLNAATGASIWNVQLGTPVTTGLCGVPLNPLGITGTPVIDPATRTIYLDAMTATATNGARHMVHALDIDGRGVERTGWPIDVTATARSGSTAFDSPVQNQRAAAILLGGKVFMAYGGHIGDCLGYHGWIVGITTAGTPQVSAWATSAFAGAIWGSSGIASDGTSLFVTTGNSKATAASGASGTSTADGNWGGGEALIKFPTTLVQPPATQTTNYFVPVNWADLDRSDSDLGGAGPVLLRVPGATPSNLAMALGKDGNAYLLDQANLGGLDAAPLAQLAVTRSAIISAAATYTTATATYVVFRGTGVGCPGATGGLTAIKVSAASPPALSIAWCGGVTATSSPAISMSNAQGANTVVWYTGSDGRLHGVDGDTGQSVVADTTALGTVRNHQTPIVANGRLFVASDNRIFAFTP